MQQPLTPRQREVWQYLIDTCRPGAPSPSYNEIAQHFGWSSTAAVSKTLKALEKKGWLAAPWNNAKRALVPLPDQTAERSRMTIPLLGTIAAGSPLEAVQVPEEIDLAEDWVWGGGVFALRVRGDSMIEDGIFDGDLIVIREAEDASDGQTVVALVDSEATVKRFYRRGDHVVLRPANSNMRDIVVGPDRQLKIQGVVIGLMRRLSPETRQARRQRRGAG